MRDGSGDHDRDVAAFHADVSDTELAANPTVSADALRALGGLRSVRRR